MLCESPRSFPMTDRERVQQDDQVSCLLYTDVSNPDHQDGDHISYLGNGVLRRDVLLSSLGYLDDAAVCEKVGFRDMSDTLVVAYECLPLKSTLPVLSPSPLLPLSPSTPLSLTSQG